MVRQQAPSQNRSARWLTTACSGSLQARLLLVFVPLSLALACVVPAFTLAVITDTVVAFAFVPFLVAVVVFVGLVVGLMTMVAVVSSNQNFTCLNIGQGRHTADPAIRSAAAQPKTRFFVTTEIEKTPLLSHGLKVRLPNWRCSTCLTSDSHWGRSYRCG